MYVKTVQNIYRTSEAVPESGAYICAEGEIKLFQKDDLFTPCPHTRESTTWKPVDDAFSTGELVPQTGRYTDENGNQVKLKEHDLFPRCLRSGEPTTWRRG
ncbi:hypothetical protein [Priestia megaterium]